MSISGRIGFWTVAVLAILIAIASSRYLTFDAAALTDDLRKNLIDHPWPFFTHTTLGPLALVVGIWQFLPATRRTAYHRWAGRTYVVAVVIASVAAFTVAFTTEGGPLAATGFVILAVLWFGTTVMAYLKVRAGRYAEHRQWMILSYALTCSAISLRIILPAGLASGLGFHTSYIIAAWGCWTVNLAIAAAILATTRPPADLPANRA